MTWRPISDLTPRDGTPVLLRGPYNDTSVAAWIDDEWVIQADGRNAIDYMSDFGTTYLTFDFPSDWMPIPE
jgi:hypothetical protein